MKVTIDKSRCVGHARCNAVSPALFPLDEEGFVDTDGFDVPVGQEKAAVHGAKACPEKVISIVNED